MYQKILVPIDRSKYSQKAIDHAVSFAEKFGSEIVLLHCYEYPVLLSDEILIYGIPESYIVNLHKNLEAHSESFLKEVRDKIKEHNVAVKIALKEGHPGENITKVAKEENVDAIIMGSRGMGALKSVLLGSTSNYVLHHTEIPLLVTRD